MKSLTALLSLALCVAVIGPSYAKPSANADHQEHQDENLIRHRPKRQYPFFGHHQQWQYERREERDLLPEILRLLQDITDQLRRPPPPPPPPIYVPYPIQYPTPVYCKCGDRSVVNISSRWPEMEDKRQNWGYDDTDEVEEDYGINARPIDFSRVPPPSSTSRPPPKVNHGTQQGEQSPRLDSTRRLQRCDTAVLSCCNSNASIQQQRSCFATSRCSDYYQRRDVCSAEHVQEVFDLITAAYSPIKN